MRSTGMKGGSDLLPAVRAKIEGFMKFALATRDLKHRLIIPYFNAGAMSCLRFFIREPLIRRGPLTKRAFL